MAFLLETFRGFIALIGIPFAIALFLEIRRIGGLSALEQRLHPKKSPPEYNKDEEDIFQESNFERNVKPGRPGHIAISGSARQGSLSADLMKSSDSKSIL